MSKLMYVVGVSTGEEVGWPGWIEWWLEAHWPEPNPDAGGDIEFEQLWRSPSIVLTGEDETAPVELVEATINQIFDESKRDIVKLLIRHARRNDHYGPFTWRPATATERLNYGAGVRWIVNVAARTPGLEVSA